MDLRVSVLLVATLALVTAGCVTKEEGPPEPEPSTGFSYQDDRFKIRSIDESAKDWVPTLEEPPEWTLGQWWKVRVSEEFTGSTTEAYRVVAGEEDDFYLVGMPTHDFSNDLMVLHIPGFGQVGKTDLSYEAHDFWFRPVQFPLTEDAAWTTGFEGAENQACSVMEVDGLKASIDCKGTRNITMTYDAELREVSKLTIEGYGSYEIIDHGFAFHEDVPEIEPVVTVPHMADLIFFHGRLGGAVKMSPEGGPIGGFGAEPLPYDTVHVDSTYDRVSFSIILGDILNVGMPPAYYSTTAIAPDGARYEATLMAGDAESLTIDSFKHDAPGGDWELEHLALGPGLAFLEGIGYHVYDVELPSGDLRPSIGEHQHGSEDAH